MMALLMGCGGSSEPVEPPPPAAPEVPGAPRGVVDGQAVDFATALVLSDGGNAMQLWLSTMPRTCADFDSGAWMGADPEQGGHDLMLTLAQLYAEGGERPWRVGNPRHNGRPSGGVSMNDPVPATVAHFDLDERITMTIDGPILLGASSVFQRPEDVTIVVDGPFSAQGCGTAKPRGKVRSRAQDALQLLSHGTRIPVLGATVRPDRGQGTTRLVLSTQGHDCDGQLRSDLVVELDYADGPTPTRISLRGLLLFDGTYQTAFGPDLQSLSIEPMDEPGVVRLGGRSNIAGFGLQLSGQVRAEVCQ